MKAQLPLPVPTSLTGVLNNCILPAINANEDSTILLLMVYALDDLNGLPDLPLGQALTHLPIQNRRCPISHLVDCNSPVFSWSHLFRYCSITCGYILQMSSGRYAFLDCYSAMTLLGYTTVSLYSACKDVLSVIGAVIDKSCRSCSASRVYCEHVNVANAHWVINVCSAGSSPKTAYGNLQAGILTPSRVTVLQQSSVTSEHIKSILPHQSSVGVHKQVCSIGQPGDPRRVWACKRSAESAVTHCWQQPQHSPCRHKPDQAAC